MLRGWLLLLPLYVCLGLIALVRPIKAQTNTPALLPANVEIPADLRPSLEKVWQRSATFRRQCARIADAPALTVQVEYMFRVPHQAQSYRALTIYKRRPDGKATAIVRLNKDSLLPELVGHEFEHVLEQLENLPLRALASYTTGNVMRHEDGVYETERARAAGRQVFDEYLTARRSEHRARPQACNPATVSYLVRDEQGRPLTETALTAIAAQLPKSIGDAQVYVGEISLAEDGARAYHPESVDWGKGRKVPALAFGNSAACALRLGQVTLTYRGKQMKLAFNLEITRTQEDRRPVIEAPPFQEGGFKLDLQDWPRDSQTVIRAARWKKI